MKKNKVLLLLSTTLSLFAIFVAAVSTFAWFQIDEKVDTGIQTGTDSSGVGVTVSDVTAYKFSYNQTDSTTTNYSTGSVISHVAKGNAANSNKHQEGDSPIDAPGEGLGAGYFIIPADNSSGVASYRYSNEGVAQLTAVENTNNGTTGLILARKNNYPLTANQTYQIKQYSFTSDGSTTTTVNNPITLHSVTINGNSASASTVSISSGKLSVGASGGGTYNVWLTKKGSYWNVGLETSTDVSTLNRSKHRAQDQNNQDKRITRATYTTYFYLYEEYWRANSWSGVVFAHYWDNSSHSGDVQLNAVSVNCSNNSNIMYASVSTSWNPANVIFACGAYAGDFSYGGNKQTGTISISSSNNVYYVNSSFGSGKANTKFFPVSASSINASYGTASVNYSHAQNGYSVTFTATPNPKYKFTKWSDNNTTNPRNVSISGATSLTANFAAMANITYYLFDPYLLAGRTGILVSGSSIPGAYFWNGGINEWGTMTKVSDAYWSVTISSYYTNVIFSSGKNSFTSKTVDITLDSTNVYHVLTDSGEPTTRTVNQYSSTYFVDADTSSTSTYNFIDKQNWGSVSVHLWTNNYYYKNDTDGFQLWPGKALTINSGVYSVTASSDYKKIILSNSDGSKQTVNISTDNADGKFYVINGQYTTDGDRDDDGSNDNGKYYGEWKPLDSLGFQLIYFDQNGNKLNSICSTLGTESGLNAVDASPGSTITLKSGGSYTYEPNKIAWFDNTNKVLYCFSFTGWYSMDACSGNEITSKTLTDSTDIVYGKMVCDTSSSNLKTIYIDNKETDTHWYDIGFHVWNLGTFDFYNGSSWDRSQTSVDVGPAKYLCPNLYRITLPSVAEFNAENLTSGGVYETGNGKQTNNITNLNSTNNGSILRITSYSSSSWLTITWVDNVGAGVTASIIKNGDTSHPIAMGVGDGVYNNYVYASGVDFDVNDYFTINLSNSTSLDYTDLDDNSSYTKFITNSSNNIKFTKAGKYAIYITTGGEIAIASIPSHGNGYYICEDADLYYNSLKMETVDSTTNKARYMDYSLTSSKTIYIRSYLDGVESSIKKYGTMADGITYSQDNAAITLPAGNYNIYVYYESSTLKISIVNFNTSDFMRLNAADPTSMSDAPAVEAQNTSLVIEAKVVLTGNKNSSITVDVDIAAVPSGFAASNYLKAACYVSNSQLLTPYETTRTYAYSGLTNLTSSNPAAATTVSLTPVSSSGVNKAAGTYYVYILIDYKPGIGSALTTLSSTGMTSNVSFRITANQY